MMPLHIQLTPIALFGVQRSRVPDTMVGEIMANPTESFADAKGDLLGILVQQASAKLLLYFYLQQNMLKQAIKFINSKSISYEQKCHYFTYHCCRSTRSFWA